MSLKSKEKQGKNNNEERKILTKKITLNKLQKISLSIASSIVLIAFVLTLIFFVRKNNSKNLIKENTYIDPELARAMTYDRLYDGEDAVYAVDGEGNITDEIVDNIKFSTFFLRDINGDGYADKIKGTCQKTDESDLLYIDFNIMTAGYLKNGLIEFEDGNYELTTSLIQDSVVGDNYFGVTNSIRLTENIENGKQKLIIGKVTPKLKNNVKNYSKNNKIIFSGVYVDENGNEIEFKKESFLSGTTLEGITFLDKIENNKSYNIKFTHEMEL